jgi:hypothetical protein
LIIYRQLLVINNQRIWNLDDAAVSSAVGGIHLCRTAECTACIAESKLLHYSGVPWCNGGFPIDSPEFVTWLLHLLMLINLCTPLANPHCGQPVTRNGAEIIDINLLPIRHPDEYDLRAVCISLKQKLLPTYHACYNRSRYNAKLRWKYYKSIGAYTGGGEALFQMHNAAHRFINPFLPWYDIGTTYGITGPYLLE